MRHLLALLVIAASSATLMAQPDAPAPEPATNAAAPGAVTPLPPANSIAHSANCGCSACQTNCCPQDCWTSFRPGWTLGVEAVLVKPHFDNNVAFTVMESDGANFETFTEREFDYDLEVSPRVWLGYESDNGVGLRLAYWQFDQDPAVVTASPPANGFGRVFPPPFGAIDISSTIPTNVMTATSTLNVYTLDFEGTKRVDFDAWWLMATGGFRYASTEQSYLVQLRNAAGVLRGEIDFEQQIEGIGPTFSIAAGRPLVGNVSVFGMARASLLYGDGETALRGGEDLDLAQPFFTRRDTSRQDLLPVGEMQIGLEWAPSGSGWQPFARSAVEGQIWDGVGDATSEDGNLGFFGFTLGVGVTR